MAKWGATNNVSSMPQWCHTASGAPHGVAGSGNTNTNVYGANVASTHGNTVFGIDAAHVSNATHHVSGTPGWTLVLKGTGPVATASINAAGSAYGNGETVTVSNGTSNATITLTSNATGNLVGAAVTNGGGGFNNVSNLVVTFNSEKHLTAITIGGTPTGYNNTDVIIASNGTVNAAASIVTNSTGGFVSGNVTITTAGLWPNATTNGQVAFAVANSTGGASGGSGATFTATLANGTGGSLTLTLGGRAGRLSMETLCTVKSMTANGAGSEYSLIP
jgi:hypothetical protein